MVLENIKRRRGKKGTIVDNWPISKRAQPDAYKLAGCGA